MKHVQTTQAGKAGAKQRKTSGAFRDGTFAKNTEEAKAAFLKHRAESGIPAKDCEPKTSLQKRMQSGGA